jgi:Zn-dependent peptidase ImmA (M78 family)
MKHNPILLVDKKASEKMKDSRVLEWMEALRKASCPMVNIKVEKCDAMVIGHYEPTKNIIRINEAVTDENLIQNTLVHELIHAYEY